MKTQRNRHTDLKEYQKCKVILVGQLFFSFETSTSKWGAFSHLMMSNKNLAHKEVRGKLKGPTLEFSKKVPQPPFFGFLFYQRLHKQKLNDLCLPKFYKTKLWFPLCPSIPNMWENNGYLYPKLTNYSQARTSPKNFLTEGNTFYLPSELCCACKVYEKYVFLPVTFNKTC